MPTALERETGSRQHQPQLAWPNSIATYSKMSTDAPIASLHPAFTLPIRRYGWLIGQSGARDEVVEHAADDLDLPIEGRTRSRQPGGVTGSATTGTCSLRCCAWRTGHGVRLDLMH
jgi:hypothetical protein